MLFIMVSKKNPLYDSISTILSPVVANFIAKKKIQDKNHIYLKEYCRFYNIYGVVLIQGWYSFVFWRKTNVQVSVTVQKRAPHKV